MVMTMTKAHDRMKFEARPRCTRAMPTTRRHSEERGAAGVLQGGTPAVEISPNHLTQVTQHVHYLYVSFFLSIAQLIRIGQVNAPEYKSLCHDMGHRRNTAPCATTDRAQLFFFSPLLYVRTFRFGVRFGPDRVRESSGLPRTRTGPQVLVRPQPRTRTGLSVRFALVQVRTEVLNRTAATLLMHSSQQSHRYMIDTTSIVTSNQTISWSELEPTTLPLLYFSSTLVWHGSSVILQLIYISRLLQSTQSLVLFRSHLSMASKDVPNHVAMT